MKPSTTTFLKFGIVALALVGVFVLIGLGKVSFHDGIEALSTIVASLVLALGLRGAGSAIVQGLLASTPAGVVTEDAAGEVTKVERILPSAGPEKKL
jgi:urea transporter